MSAPGYSREVHLGQVWSYKGFMFVVANGPHESKRPLNEGGAGTYWHMRIVGTHREAWFASGFAKAPKANGRLDTARAMSKRGASSWAFVCEAPEAVDAETMNEIKSWSRHDADMSSPIKDVQEMVRSISGTRRSGKTALMNQIASEYMKQNPEAKVIYYQPRETFLARAEAPVDTRCADLRASLPVSGEHVESRMPCLDLNDWGRAASIKAIKDVRSKASTLRDWPVCPVSKVDLEIKTERKTQDRGRLEHMEILRVWTAHWRCPSCQGGGK